MSPIRQQLNRTKELMNQHIDDCLITGYEHQIEALNLLESERAFLKQIGGGCSVPVGALAKVDGKNLYPIVKK